LFENIYIQLNLLDACCKNNVRTYINLGSSCIYPKKSRQPIKEDYLLSGKLESTNEAYAIAKIVGLKSCEFYNRQFKTNYFTVNAMQHVWDQTTILKLKVVILFQV
jgi:GDP-L-fucose synthase